MTLPSQPVLLTKRRTKIVATLGPATRTPANIAELIARGVDVFRLNMSHGEPETHREDAARVRAAAEAAGRTVALLFDLCGPKIRVGRFQGGAIRLTAGEAVTVTTRDVLGEPGLVPSRYEHLADDVRTGHRILLDDGQLELQVESRAGTEVTCRVVHGGRLSDHKGMNLPDGELTTPALTDKDRRDAAFAVEEGADFVALSFVRRPEDLVELRGLMPQGDDAPALIAKIERPEALANIAAILEASDGVMVARGDLGVELPLESVPTTQDDLVDLARRHHKPVIIATQMLDSMIRNPRPTRAEVADIAHAVHSGADALMLSGETAVGQYALESVAIMDRVVRYAEARLWRESAFHSLTLRDTPARPMPFGDAFGRAVSGLSRDLGVRTILVVSRSGTTGRVLSSSRPAAPVLAATPSARICRCLALCWGVLPLLASEEDIADPTTLVRRLAEEHGLADSGQSALIVHGFRPDPRESQPSLAVVTV